ncbi:MAG: tetratricopeptide repeat protein [Coxiellaceae bacterium]|nr:tetratricopeptide repeat protein [Coxiellaceae bacterium]
MSLINQMLKDLESGRQRNDKGFSILRKLRPANSHVSGLGIHPAWLLLFAVAMVALAAWLIPSRQHNQAKNQQMSVQQKQALVDAIQKTAVVTLQATKPKPTAMKASLPAKAVVTLPKAQQIVSSPEPLRQPTAVTSDAAVKSRVPLAPQEKITVLYEQAQQAMDDSDDDKAIDLLKELLVRAPKNLEARQLLATILLTDNRIEEARPVIAVGLKRVPDYAPFDSLEARILMSEGKVQQAIEQLNQASPAIATAPEYYSLLAALYQQNEQFMMAAQLYHQLVQLNPASGVWWMGLGIALESAEKNNAAVEAFQRAKKAVGLSPAAKAYVQQQLDKLS